MKRMAKKMKMARKVAKTGRCTYILIPRRITKNIAPLYQRGMAIGYILLRMTDTMCNDYNWSMNCRKKKSSNLE